jgi:hypothetical protein
MRFAQDDAFFEGTEKYLVGCKNAKRSKKSQALGMTKERRALPFVFDTDESTADPSTSLRSGRDDNFVAKCELSRELINLKMNCHPDRSVAKWRDLRLKAVCAYE